MEEVVIKIPRADEKEVVIIPKGYLGFQQEVTKRFDKIDNILFGVIAAVLVSLVAVVIGLIGLFLDQMRYNNAAYREYTNELRILNESASTSTRVDSCYSSIQLPE